MKIGVLGTGQVGGAIRRKLATAAGHEVMLGSRDHEAKASAFAGIVGLSVGTLKEASTFGEWVVNALPGEASLRVLGDWPLMPVIRHRHRQLRHRRRSAD